MITNFDEQAMLIAGDIQIDTITNKVLINDQHIPFTGKEYQLLLYLACNQNKLVTRHAIIERVWGKNIPFTTNIDFIYTHLKNIRKKIKQAGGGVIIRSVYGSGYKLVVFPPTAASR